MFRRSTPSADPRLQKLTRGLRSELESPSRRALVRGLACCTGVFAYDSCLRPALVGLQSVPAHGPPAKARGRLRLACWNLRNFNAQSCDCSASYPSRRRHHHRDLHSDGHDLASLRAQIEAMDADLWSFQEVNQPAALAELLGVDLSDPSQSSFAASTTGGAHNQFLATYLPDSGAAMRTRIVDLREHTELSLGGRVRPALSSLVDFGAGRRVRVINVHLKARPSGYALRRQQWQMLAALVEQRSDGLATLVQGDFNCTGPQGGSPAGELEALGALFAQVGLTFVGRGQARRCSAYWEGRQFDSWKEPSLLDMHWWRAPTPSESWQGKIVASGVAGACLRFGCRAVSSPRGRPVQSLAHLSDHCPVFVDIAADERNDPLPPTLDP